MPGPFVVDSDYFGSWIKYRYLGMISRMLGSIPAFQCQG